MKSIGLYPRVHPGTAGAGVVSLAGAVALVETMRAAGLDTALSVALAPWRKPLARHDPGKVIADLAIALALGGDCLADVGLLRAEPGVFGAIASDPTVSRTIDALAADAGPVLAAIDGARASARARVWALAGEHAPDHEVRGCQMVCVRDRSETEGVIVTVTESDPQVGIFGPPRPEPSSAREVVNEMVDAGLLDELMDRVDDGGLSLTGDGGFLPELVKAVLERGLQAELTGHLGYEKGDPSGRGSPNSRNGTTPKTVATEVGDALLAVPRDRNSTFDPRLVPKGSRRLGGLDEMIISLYAGGMTVRDVGHHLARTLGVELSHDTISKITDSVLEEVRAWQARPLEEIYPIIYLDALVVKVRDGHTVANRAAHIAVGVDLDGVKHVLGIWVQAHEGAKFWAGVCAELRNRGVRDVLIVCCDGLSGFPEAIEATWPKATVQTCTVHLIRAAMRFVSYQDRRKVAAALRPIYTAPTVEAAETELLTFADSELGHRYPATVATWHNAWERFIPFLAFPPDLRKIIYTTNAIESLNYQLRKIIKNRGHFPNDDAAIKLLWLAIRDIEDKRARARAKEKGIPKGQRKATGRLVEGAAVQGWKQALGALVLHYPGRLTQHIN